MPSKLPPAARLRRLLTYDAVSGKLFWRERQPRDFPMAKNAARECRRWNARYAEKEAFTANKQGYKKGLIDGVGYVAHRVIWKMIYDEEPGDELDHRDRDRGNNRLCNLADGSCAENHKNRSRYKNNTSGISGVRRKGSRWFAYITADGAFKWLGSFVEFDDAVAARKAALAVLGFNPAHGQDNLHESAILEVAKATAG